MALVVIQESKDAKRLIELAARFARARSLALRVLLCESVARSGFFYRSAKLPKTATASDDLQPVLTAAADCGAAVTRVSAPRQGDLARAVLAEVAGGDVSLLILGYDGAVEGTSVRNRLSDRLLRFAPCEVLVLDPGDCGDDAGQRVLVPVHGRYWRFALSRAEEVAGEGGVVALRIATGFGPDAAAIARKELELEIREADSAAEETLQPEVNIARDVFAGAVSGCREHHCDLILAPGTTPRIIDRLRAEEHPGDVPGLDRHCVVGVLRPRRGARSWLDKLADSSVYNWLPKLKPADRIALFDRLQVGAVWNADFLTMMGLSTMLAALGLLQDSTAVVIGAMLVAPLMTPLIGAGLALVQGNIRLFGAAGAAMALGVLTGLILSLLTGLATSSFPFTEELASRGEATVIDLGVALLSGMAAAYAIARPNVLAAMAGVAIAAALVPPLATTGLSLASGRWAIAAGAATLLLTNLVAITLGAASVFALLGVGGSSKGLGTPVWVRRTFIGLLLTSTLLLLLLGSRFSEQITRGETRPLGYPIATQLENALLQRIGQEPGVSLILAGRDSGVKGEVDVPFEVGLLLAANRPVSAAFKQELKDMVKSFRGQEVEVSVWVLQHAPEPSPEASAKGSR
jgi:uncharacterized hydrophobic protein (TIGR00271 family)